MVASSVAHERPIGVRGRLNQLAGSFERHSDSRARHPPNASLPEPAEPASTQRSTSAHRGESRMLSLVGKNDRMREGSVPLIRALYLG